jgi:hypothetical protein
MTQHTHHGQDMLSEEGSFNEHENNNFTLPNGIFLLTSAMDTHHDQSLPHNLSAIH